VTINSNPSGADIFIEGRNYGQTPATIRLEAKNQTVVLTKEGYGSAQLQLEALASIKNGKCAADMAGAILIVPLYSALWSGYCNEFKEKEYFVNIPNIGAPAAGQGRGTPMVGTGNDPKQMIDYYYNQDMQQYRARR